MKSKLMCVAGLLLFAAVPLALASSTWYVDGVKGNDNNNCKTPQTACKTIGHAISLASSGDTIKVAAATYKENLSIGISLKVIGAGAKTTIIDGGGVYTVIQVSGSPVTLSKLTIRNGAGAVNGGGIYNTGLLTVNNSILSGNSAVAGGAISNSGGVLTINKSTLSRNSATDSGGGIYLVDGSVTINNSTLNGNTAPNAGGAYMAGYPLIINNSTIHGNNASQNGGVGGLVMYGGGNTVITNSTISGNRGGGVLGNGLPIRNSILANNVGGNCIRGVNSEGYNLSSDSTCNFDGSGDLNNTDPKLGTLKGNGGPTQTQALLPGSPAIDAGNPNGCTDGNGHLLKTDQRGKPRPDREDETGCDMGAYERQSD